MLAMLSGDVVVVIVAAAVVVAIAHMYVSTSRSRCMCTRGAFGTRTVIYLTLLVCPSPWGNGIKYAKCVIYTSM